MHILLLHLFIANITVIEHNAFHIISNLLNVLRCILWNSIYCILVNAPFVFLKNWFSAISVCKFYNFLLGQVASLSILSLLYSSWISVYFFYNNKRGVLQSPPKGSCAPLRNGWLRSGTGNVQGEGRAPLSHIPDSKATIKDCVKRSGHQPEEAPPGQKWYNWA